MQKSIARCIAMAGLAGVFILSFSLTAHAQRVFSMEKEGEKFLIKNQALQPSRAEITTVKYYLAPYEAAGGKVCVFFEVALKNISDKAARFKTTISLADGESAAGLYPLTGKPPVLKPGASFSQPIPIVFSEQIPSGFTIQVDEVEVE